MTPSLPILTDLQRRVREAPKEGDREIDLAIWRTLGGGPLSEIQLPWFQCYTTSLDAALGLVVSHFPKEWSEILRRAISILSKRHHWHMEFCRPDQAKEMPLALLDALLSALIAQAEIRNLHDENQAI